jgi:hypothetical protein
MRLRGRWLAKLGFYAGQKVHIEAMYGRLILTIQAEAEAEGEDDGEDSPRRA